MRNSILFDIGATKTRMAYLADGENFETPIIFETPKNFDEAVLLFTKKALSIAGDRAIESVVGGMSRAIFGGYDSFREKIENELKVKVTIENDAALAGLGEAIYGAGKGFSIVAYITVSTGVGGAKIVNGKIDERTIGFEPGKQIIDINTGKTLEDMISGRALAERSGMHPKEITDPNVWDEHAKFLAIGLNNIIVEWSPNVVVLGGSMITGNPSIPLDKVEEYLKQILKVFPEIPAIKKATLGDFGGLWGALAYLK